MTTQADNLTCSRSHQHVMYLIDSKNKTCQKQALTSQFHPMKIPCTSTLLGQVVLGSLSVPGEGLLVNSWAGEDQGTHTKANLHPKWVLTLTLCVINMVKQYNSLILLYWICSYNGCGANTAYCNSQCTK